MAVSIVGTTSIATLSAAGGDQSVNNTTHTVPSGTDMLLHLVAIEGHEEPHPTTPSVWDATDTAVDLSLIYDTGVQSSTDVRVLVYALANPQALTNVTARWAFATNGSPAVSMWVNLAGINASADKFGISVIADDVNTTGTSTTVLASGGAAPHGIIAFAAAQSNAMAPSSVAGFTEEEDGVTAATTDDIAYNLSTLFGGAPSGATFSWGSTNENTGLTLHAIPSGLTGSGVGYYHSNYFASGYWHANYHPAAGTISGDYWQNNYWHSSYWHPNYWVEVNDGDILQNNAAQIGFNTFVPAVNTGINALANTAVLPLNTFQADANIDVNVTPGPASLGLTTFNATLGLIGYQAGDFELIFAPDATITVTYGVVPTTESIGFGVGGHTIEDGEGVNVNTSTTTLDLTSYLTDTSLNTDVEPLPKAIPLNAFDTTAGIGIQVGATLASVPFNTATHTIVATDASQDVGTQFRAIPLSVYQTFAVGFSPDTVPLPTFGDYSVENDDAFEFASNYEICDISGFRVKRGGLRETWNGLKVRPESWQPRHPQDFVKARAEKLEGSERPEQEDRFITDRITADQL